MILKFKMRNVSHHCQWFYLQEASYFIRLKVEKYMRSNNNAALDTIAEEYDECITARSTIAGQ